MRALVFLIVPHVWSYRWVHFSRAVLVCQPHQQLFTHSKQLDNKESKQEQGVNSQTQTDTKRRRQWTQFTDRLTSSITLPLFLLACYNKTTRGLSYYVIFSHRVIYPFFFLFLFSSSFFFLSFFFFFFT